LIVCKGLVGKSGASLFAGNLVISGRLLGNTDENAGNTAEFLIKYHNQFLIDQEWARRCGQWIENTYYPELEEAGLYFRRDDAGQVVTSPGKIRSVAANVQGNSGVRSWTCGASRSSGQAFQDWKKPWQLRCSASRTVRSAACSASTSSPARPWSLPREPSS
jgi:hypothetical protein